MEKCIVTLVPFITIFKRLNLSRFERKRIEILGRNIRRIIREKSLMLAVSIIYLL